MKNFGILKFLNSSHNQAKTQLNFEIYKIFPNFLKY